MSDPIGISKITRNFQVSIPPEVRIKLKLELGKFLAFVEKDGKVYISVVKA